LDKKKFNYNYILKFLKEDLNKVQIKRLIKNFISDISLNIIGIITQLIFPPLMIMIYGLEGFGIWIFLTAIPSSLTIINLNINAAANTQMSIFYNKKNKKGMCETYTNSVFTSLFIIFILIIISLLLINFYDFDLNIFDKLDTYNLKIILIYIFTSLYINLIADVLRIGLTYKGKLYQDTYIESFFLFFSKFLIIIFSLVFESFLLAAIALFLGSVFRIITYYYYFLKHNKGTIMFSSKLFSLKQSKKLLKLSFPYYLWSVNHFVKNSFQIIIIGLYFNANIVGLITTFKTLFYFLPIKITNIIGRSLTYEFTKYYAEKKFSLLKKIFAKFIKTISICMIIYIIIISVIGESIYNLWITNLQIFDYILMILIILDVSIYIIGYYFAIINRSINNFLSQSVFDTLMNISTILIFVYLYKWYQSYYLLFILNIITTILLLLFSIYMAKKVIKSFDLVGK